MLLFFHLSLSSEYKCISPRQDSVSRVLVIRVKRNENRKCLKCMAWVTTPPRRKTGNIQGYQTT